MAISHVCPVLAPIASSTIATPLRRFGPLVTRRAAPHRDGQIVAVGDRKHGFQFRPGRKPHRRRSPPTFQTLIQNRGIPITVLRHRLRFRLRRDDLLVAERVLQFINYRGRDGDESGRSESLPKFEVTRPQLGRRAAVKRRESCSLPTLGLT